MKTRIAKGHPFERLSSAVTRSAGSTSAFIIAVSIIVLWLATGPIFRYSDTWQLVINTGTTIITFLMVFLIQRSQNKESLVVHLKLNELIASSQLASNRLIDIENLTEDELAALEEFYNELVKMSTKEGDMHQSHSIDEASQYYQFNWPFCPSSFCCLTLRLFFIHRTNHSVQETPDGRTLQGNHRPH
jgi:low affinity Fe/Cu permease